MRSRPAPRHAAASRPVFRVPSLRWMTPVTVGAARLVPLVPLAVMVRPLADRAPDLQVYGGQVLGLGATLCLLSCLTVTPVARLVRFRTAAQWRRWMGLCMFWTGVAGAVIAATGGPRDQWGMRLSGNVQAWTGTVVVIALVPLAFTANKWSQKMLGTYWKVWQRRLVWAVWVVVAVHVLSLAAWRAEAAFFMASGPLLVARVPAVRKDAGQWKASGYADSARWVLAGAASGVFACGMAFLLAAEVTASVSAVRLA